MTRIPDNLIVRSLTMGIRDNRASLNKYAEEVSSGLKVRNPGDSSVAGTIESFQQALVRFEGHSSRLAEAKSVMSFQENILGQGNDVLVRAKEIAQQAANTTNEQQRASMAEEVFALRDQLASLANSQYQGKYIYGGLDDDDPPYDQATHTNPATGDASVHYVADTEPGTGLSRRVRVSDDLVVRVNSSGSLWENSLNALERLGRSLSGFQSGPASTPAAPAPVDPTIVPPAAEPTNRAYTFPAELGLQQSDILNAIDLIDSARENDLGVERIDLAGRIGRLETAESLIDIGKVNAQQVLDRLQNADIVESASNLQLAQTALEASLNVTTQLLRQSILDFI